MGEWVVSALVVVGVLVVVGNKVLDLAAMGHNRWVNAKGRQRMATSLDFEVPGATAAQVIALLEPCAAAVQDGRAERTAQGLRFVRSTGIELVFEDGTTESPGSFTAELLLEARGGAVVGSYRVVAFDEMLPPLDHMDALEAAIRARLQQVPGARLADPGGPTSAGAVPAASPIPGWYADPLAAEALRYWDGQRWTTDTRAW